MERILSDNESMQNQLSLTSKIKTSLENELVQSKLQHATEMQNVIQKFSNAEKKLNELVREKTELKGQLDKKVDEIKRLKSTIEGNEDKMA